MDWGFTLVCSRLDEERFELINVSVGCFLEANIVKVVIPEHCSARSRPLLGASVVCQTCARCNKTYKVCLVLHLLEIATYGKVLRS